jgi:integrase
MAIFKKRGEYWIDYYVGGRRRREKIGPSKKLAAAVLAKRKVQIAENRYLDKVETPTLLWDELAQMYLEHARLHHRSYKSHALHRCNTLRSYFEGKKISEISPQNVEAYKLARAQVCSRQTVNNELSVMRAMYNLAIRLGKAKLNPVKGVKFFRVQNQRVRYLTQNEAKLLLAYCDRSIRPIVIIALNTGMRKSEILGLKWSQIDLDQGEIILTRTKNNEIRRIPINAVVKRVLSDQPRAVHHPYVFANQHGRVPNFRKLFELAVRRAGIDDFRFHDLRHTYASWLRMQGVDIRTIADLLGHKSLQMSLRYSHLSPSHLKRAVEGLEQLWQKKAQYC